MELFLLFICGLVCAAEICSALNMYSDATLSISPPAVSTAPTFRLSYFDARGAAEVTRILMKIADVEFTDRRFPIPSTLIPIVGDSEYDAAKNVGQFSVNMDRVPVLDIDGDLTIGQSRAIERYVAAKCKLFGGNDEERAMIDCITENVHNIKERYAAIRRSDPRINGAGVSDSVISSWFQHGGDLHQWLIKLEKSLPPVSHTRDFAVGSALSLADVSIWHLLRDYFHDHLPDVLCIERSAQCTRLSQIAQKVSEHCAVSKWLDQRPPSPF